MAFFKAMEAATKKISDLENATKQKEDRIKEQMKMKENQLLEVKYYAYYYTYHYTHLLHLLFYFLFYL